MMVAVLHSNSAALPSDFQAVVNGGDVPGLGTTTARNGVTLYQRAVLPS